MTSLPDWLVERVALDEVPAASRERVDRADPRELDVRIAALRDASAGELAAHPAGPAVAQIEARIAGESRRRTVRRRLAWLGLATTAATAVLVVRLVGDRGVPGSRPAPGREHAPATISHDEITRAKGTPRLAAFRQVGNQVERLAPDALVHAGDLLQLGYSAGGQGYGLIASVDGAGVVTLHFPLREDAPPEATAVSPKPTTLSASYALDDAPRFERFFFLTANDPIDVQQSLAALHNLAHRTDSADANLELAAGVHQWSLRLRKPDHASPHHESP